MFGTLKGLIHYLLMYQLTSQVKQSPTVSINRDYVRITPFSIDTTTINYNSKFTDGEGNNSLNSTFIYQQNLNGKQNLTQQDIQIPSHFVNEELLETMPTTTQQSISSIPPTFTTPEKNTAFRQTTIQSTMKPSVFPKYSQMDIKHSDK